MLHERIPITVGWIDLAAQRVHRGATEVKLSTREVQVLSLLASRPGEIVSYEELLREIWETTPNSKAARQAIKRLRPKIEQDPQNPEHLISEFGNELQSEHERFLVEKVFKKPVVITDYPKKIKAFYMRLNDDNKTVRAMDILFPGIGEIIGGSQREERLDVLNKNILDFNIDKQELWWYLETRKFGTCEHSGFGLGLERLVMFVTGMKNIRDVIPFPRTPKNVSF